eukprot:GILI01012398.1.p2 GENE.GILI01012398.1~~GILI01012398.1.p2  ORF type:complete len:132 (-),score=44.52 GILI01012398.1:34-429(-)
MSKRILYVGGLDEQVTTDTLHAAFIPFGPVKTVEMPVDKKTSKHRGFAFVEFEDVDDASHAVENMHESELFGKVIKVNVSSQAQLRKSASKAVWADDEYYKKALKEQGYDEVEEDLDDLPEEEVDLASILK